MFGGLTRRGHSCCASCCHWLQHDGGSLLVAIVAIGRHEAVVLSSANRLARSMQPIKDKQHTASNRSTTVSFAREQPALRSLRDPSRFLRDSYRFLRNSSSTPYLLVHLRQHGLQRLLQVVNPLWPRYRRHSHHYRGLPPPRHRRSPRGSSSDRVLVSPAAAPCRRISPCRRCCGTISVVSAAAVAAACCRSSLC